MLGVEMEVEMEVKERLAVEERPGVEDRVVPTSRTQTGGDIVLLNQSLRRWGGGGVERILPD